jgi:hypothetical protein
VTDASPAAEPRRTPRWLAAALLCALLLSVANAFKPIVIDDPVYVSYARQILAHPGDPYGFELYWYDAPEPAMRIGTVPAVLPYWLAGSMALVGDSPFAWKLCLLPFALALTGSLGFLLDRFARPLTTLVLATLALGPSVLPGFALMLDVPAVALGLLGFALCVRACERASAGLALLSGLVLALAMQTKYSAVVYPALALVQAALARRPREGALIALSAGGLFVAWEALLFAHYGQSHFLAGIERVQSFDNLGALTEENQRRPGSSAFYWVLNLLSLLGSTAPYAALLALVGLGSSRRIVAGAALAVALGFASIAAFPRAPAFESSGFFSELVAYHPEVLLFAPLGAGVAGCLALAIRRLLRRPGERADRRPERLLCAWLLLELAAYFVISPYPAVRRVIGLGIAATLLAARLAAQRSGERDARAGVAIATGFGLALGALYFASDLSDALARRALIDHVERRLTKLGASAAAGRVWYTGHWETQFYGERKGWRPVIAGRSRLAAGDWLVIPAGVDQPRISYPPAFRRVDALAAASPLPFSTIPSYYGSAMPLRRRQPVQVVAVIYRTTAAIEPTLEPQAPPAAQPKR